MAQADAQTFVSLAPDTRPVPRSPFDFALQRLLDDLFAAQPVWATGVGFHAHDDRWPDLSEAGRTSRLALLRHHRARFEAFEDEELSSDERIDRRIVLGAIDEAEFNEGELREPAWDPLYYVYVMGSGLFGLLAREFAPWSHRGSAFLARVAGLRAVLEQARGALTGLPDRPVSLLHTEAAIRQLDGVAELIAQGRAEAERRAKAGEEPQLPGALEAAEREARAALDAFAAFLGGELRPRAEGEGRLGDRLFAAKLRHTLASDLAPAELEARAQEEFRRVRAEMLAVARQIWREWLPEEPPPDAASTGSPAAAEDALVRRVLDRIAREHRPADQLLSFSQAEVARIEEFCRQREVIGLADEPLAVTWTPVFMRAYGRAFLDSPGPLDKGQRSYFWITPPDESGGPEAVEGYLREENDRMLRLLAIHEGVPGHYLQLSRANRCPSLARAIFASGTFIEGWAVYVTQAMIDLGFGADDQALLLTHLKYYLRAVTNALMDVQVHTAGMTEQQAMELMVGGGFQEEDEARAKWLRARLTATQLSTYFVGSLELSQLEADVREREGEGFDYRRHLESVISHGSPPVRSLRTILLGEDAATRA
ncbi:MAG TPA: DUF885 domain-containing protein [Candidatus Limnocylindrales bacterium]|nr:DUF885 domain-containing protein [Candidatus Limnocylindrales bacterium]